MEERSEILQKCMAVARIAFVYFFLFFLMLLNATRLPAFDLGSITPYFLLMGIYYWILARPSLLPYYLVFIYGLGLDLISSQVVGLNALCFLVIAFILYGQRRFLKGQAWLVLWAGYGLACIFVSLVHLIVFILMHWSWPGLFPMLATIVVSMLAYPMIAAPMVAINRLFR